MPIPESCTVTCTPSASDLTLTAIAARVAVRGSAALRELKRDAAGGSTQLAGELPVVGRDAPSRLPQRVDEKDGETQCLGVIRGSHTPSSERGVTRSRCSARLFRGWVCEP